MIKTKLVLITSTVILTNILIDRITKNIASYYLKGEGFVSFLSGLIKITYVENTGAFLSLGSNWPIIVKYIFLIIIPIVFCLYGIYYCVFKSDDIKKIVLISMIIGGGLGNIIDRTIYNFSVIDFLNFGIHNVRTGILNVADLSITFGAIALFFYESSINKRKSIE